MDASAWSMLVAFIVVLGAVAIPLVTLHFFQKRNVN
jgi:hypothetical protein